MSRPIRVALFVLSLTGAAALGAWGMTLVGGRPNAAACEGADDEHGEHGHEEHGPHAEGVVEMPPAKQQSAGIAVEPAGRGELTLTRWATGKVAPNEDRLAHIFSLVEGTVHEVKVGYGDRVKAGDALVMIDSKEVGQAKLALIQSQLGARIAKVNLGWKQTIAENTQALIKDLDQGIAPQQIADRFREKPMGKYREELVSAYARLFQARAEFDRARALVERKSISQREYEKAKADYEAAQATFNSQKEPRAPAQARALRRDRAADRNSRGRRSRAGLGGADRRRRHLRFRPSGTRRIRAARRAPGTRRGRRDRDCPRPEGRRADRRARHLRAQGRAEAQRAGRGRTSPLAIAPAEAGGAFASASHDPLSVPEKKARPHAQQDH